VFYLDVTNVLNQPELFGQGKFSDGAANTQACFGAHKNAHSDGVGVTIPRKVASFSVGA
jgi:hypothetical protein